ncbi:MAG: hypothetical protein ACKV0T_30605 [Planctomycetales bacterium]
MHSGSHRLASKHRAKSPRAQASRPPRAGHDLRPVAAFRERGLRTGSKLEDFSAPERWHDARDQGKVRYVIEPPGPGFVHAVTRAEVAERISLLPPELTVRLAVVQWSGMTRKRQLFPCYGMQWGAAVYLYPIEESLVETYHRPPTPQQQIEARMYGGRWFQEGRVWRLAWTAESIRDFYLNNVLIHEIGHVHDTRNTNSRDRERFANWFAIEYGYRPTR